MDKLIELLNEREEKEKTSKIKWRIDNNPIGIYWYVWKYWLWFASKMIIISKEYGFIKRLVNNNKIDLKELSEKELATWWNLENNILDEENTKESWVKFWTESLLMLLSISDTPIDDLISYLK